MMPITPEETESLTRIGHIKPFEADEMAEIYLFLPDGSAQPVYVSGEWLLSQGMKAGDQIDLTLPQKYQPETEVYPISVRLHETTEAEKEQIRRNVDAIMGTIDLNEIREKFGTFDGT